MYGASANVMQAVEKKIDEVIQKAVDAWLKAHAEEIRAKVEEAAERVVGETTLFEEVARQQFTHFLSKMAEAAVEKAAAKKGRADKRKGKKAT